MKVLVILITGAFLLGGALVETRLATSENAGVLKAREEAVKAVPKLQRNQKEIAKGVNYNGQVLRAVALKVGAELPERETVELEDGGQ